MRKTSLLFSACLFLQATSIFSQQSTEKLDEPMAIFDSIVIDEVVVSSIRAQKNTPTTYSILDKSEINKTNLGQDAPYLLNMQPSVVVSSEAGAGIGYTSMTIRGSDKKKINVTINGVPLNDAESHGVYWVDVPDISSSAQSIQIQRGVGTSTNGSGAFGASINILTNNYSSKPFLEYSGAVGSYNTIKNSLHVGSGLIKKHWFAEAKIGQIKSDGYRDRAWSNLRNYFSQLGYTTDQTLVKLVAFGGWEETYQAWYGINKKIRDSIRTYNPAGFISTDSDGKEIFYDQMIDHYQQDHIQLHFAHKFNEHLKLNMALHYTYGRGYYQDYFSANDQWGWYPITNFNIAPIINGTDTTLYSDIVHRLWLQNHYYGQVWGLNYSKDKLNLAWGGGIHQYTPAKHFGEVIWAKDPSIKLDNKPYYENEASKSDFNNYLKVNYLIEEKLNLYGDVQFRAISYNAWGNNREYTDGKISINTNYFFLNPKFGAYFEINKTTNVYSSFAIANREPNRDDFMNSTAGTKPKSETLYDLEIGGRHYSKNFNFEIVLYNMNYKNQLVLTGALDTEGSPLRKNVDKSYRQGIELSIGIKPLSFISFEGNIALSTNKLINFPTQDSVGAPIILKNNTIPYSPSIISGHKISFIPVDKFEFSILGKYVGKQYLDNNQMEDRSLISYYITDIHVNYLIEIEKFGKFNLLLNVNNLLNKKYDSYGSISSSGKTKFFPQATRNFMFGLNYKF